MRDIDEIIDDLVEELVKDDDGSDEAMHTIRANTQKIVYGLQAKVMDSLESHE